MRHTTNFQKPNCIGNLKNKELIYKTVQIENHIFNLHDFNINSIFPVANIF